MDSSAIKKYFLDFYETPLPNVIPRNYRFSKENRPQIIIGARRIGKTYLLFQRIHELIAEGVRKSQILYLNFEDIAFSDLEANEIPDILEIYWALFPHEIDKTLYLFIDEPQCIKNWDLAILTLMKHNFPIYITGSSSKLLSSEIASAFRGRSTPIFFYSLSFDEFLRFRNFNYQKSLSSKNHALLEALFQEYLEYGGYPEVVLEPEIYRKQQILRNYYDTIIYRDLIERYNIKNGFLIKEFLKTLIKNIANPLSINKIYKDFKSRKINTTTDTLYKYLDILQEIGIFYLVYRYDPSLRREIHSIPKIYLHDLGLISLFSRKNISARYENLVFMELKRKIIYYPFRSIGFWRTPQNREIDFIIRDRDEVIEAIQVSASFLDLKTKKREISSLIMGIRNINQLCEFSLHSGMIITHEISNNEPNNLFEKDIQICIKDLLEWLLEKNKENVKINKENDEKK
ncbi:MAG: ATP-binding protein [Candidatus Lokiarchaeota archaeon]|nr:ATP-binding protein [Candidatus Harpocratesius repetitus]